MARTAICPSCGAPVEFKSAVSLLAVCDYCKSTLVRQGEALKNLGKMAELVEDRSPLQRGAEGRWQGRHFGLIGRLQLRYEAGLWNEWHLWFDNGESGWLSEAGGEYVLSLPTRADGPLPNFADLKIGDRHRIDGREFSVTNILTAECVAGEGELPFKVGAGYTAPVADLRAADGGFATFDYSDDPARPVVFVGASVDFAALDWRNLRADTPLPKPTIKTRAFDCPSCGASLQVAHENIASVGCGSCGAVLDTGDATVKLLSAASLRRDKIKPLLPLGSRGTLRGEAVEAVGFMRRRMQADGTNYYWSEYLLLTADGQPRWLVESQGHWSLGRTLSRALAAQPAGIRHAERDYRHFQSYNAHVDFVIGEFTWRVKLDEQARVEDYVAPPYLLSRETTGKEQTWTEAEYLEPTEIQTAFRLAVPLPIPQGVQANQPNPYTASHKLVCRRFWRFALAACVIHIALLFLRPGGSYVDQTVAFDAQDDEPHLTREFKLADERSHLEIEHDTNLDNNWLGLNLTLVNQDSGAVWQAAREVGYYQGVDDGESWSEGSRSAAIVFRDLPPGTYRLAVEGELDPNSRPVQAQIKVNRTGPRWSSLLLLLLALAPFPIYSRIRSGTFEVARWAESDHPIVTTAEDDD